MTNTVTLSNGEVITKLMLKGDRDLVSLNPGGKYYIPPPPAIYNRMRITTDGYQVLVKFPDGTVDMWGWAEVGQGHSYLMPAGLTGIEHISTGFYHSLALKDDGTVVGWGANNAYGQISGPVKGLKDLFITN